MVFWEKKKEDTERDRMFEETALDAEDFMRNIKDRAREVGEESSQESITVMLDGLTCISQMAAYVLEIIEVSGKKPGAGDVIQEELFERIKKDRARQRARFKAHGFH